MNFHSRPLRSGGGGAEGSDRRREIAALSVSKGYDLELIGVIGFGSLGCGGVEDFDYEKNHPGFRFAGDNRWRSSGAAIKALFSTFAIENLDQASNGLS